MSRSEAVRQEALERDEHRCQITGAGGPEWQGVVQVAHWQRLGSGGSDELDNVKNVITLEAGLHMTEEHPAVSIPTIRILHWEPDDLSAGLIVERRVLGSDSGHIDDEWQEIPKQELWFYRRQMVGRVKGNLGNMHAIQTLTGFHAMNMYELRLVWRELYPDAESYDQVVSSLGWDPGDANDVADKHEWLLVNECGWPEGLTDRQLTDIINYAAPLTLFDEEDTETPTTDMQTMLVTAASKSFSALREAMIAKKLRTAQPYYYIVMDASMLPYRGDDDSGDLLKPRIAFVQTRDEAGMKQAIRERKICEDVDHPIVFRVGKAVMGIEARRNLFALKSGERIEVLQWPITAADQLATVLPAYGIKEEDDDNG